MYSPGHVSGSPDASTHRAGLAFGLGAYALWGVAPLFWHLLDGVPAGEQFGQRIVWSCVFFVLWSFGIDRLRAVRSILATRRDRRRLALAALCVSTNWFVFVYAVMVDRVLDVSLGYFINPLVSVALGRFVLGERLRPLQAAAVAIAIIGVALVAIGTGGLPWISLVLAFSFGTYGLIRKTTAVTALAGSTFETIVLLPLALGGLVWMQLQGDGHMLGGETRTVLLLLCTGPVTAVPLYLFANAARRLPLTTVGFIQYLAPSIQFALAVFAFGEAVEPMKLVAFGLVWTALVVFTMDGLRSRAPSA